LYGRSKKPTGETARADDARVISTTGKHFSAGMDLAVSGGGHDKGHRSGQ
jgi:enoyl-CoA hydratase/carnithine racemase